MTKSFSHKSAGNDNPGVLPAIMSGIHVLTLLFFLFVLIRTAWVSDDAYFTFRTIDNLINGYGLVWNVGERVQAYTHPVWMFLLAGVYAVTHEIFFSSMVVSIIVSIAAAYILAFRIARTPFQAAISILILAFSRAFTDYSTSGLENPLTHLLLAGFLLITLQEEQDTRRLVWLSLLAGLATFNRMDTLLLFLPALLVECACARSVSSLAVVASGFVPFVIWEIFSIWYYGFPFPNTAYAKLGTGTAGEQLFWQGLHYLAVSLKTDPITLIATAGGMLAVIGMQRWRTAPIVLGMMLYLAYVVKIGGDFMNGRFLSAVLLAAATLLAWMPMPVFSKRWQTITASMISLGLVFGIGVLLSPRPTILSDQTYAPDIAYESGQPLPGDHGILDERGGYYWCSGLLPALFAPDTEFPNCDWTEKGRQARLDHTPLLVACCPGSMAFYAGPETHIVEPFALADPLLARLPAQRKEVWMIGHFERTLPTGYLETLSTGTNQILDRSLSEYYEHLSLIIRGDLWDSRRLATIWAMNTGQYHHLIISDEQLQHSAGQIDLVDEVLPGQFIGGIENTITLTWQPRSEIGYEIYRSATLLDRYGNALTRVSSDTLLMSTAGAPSPIQDRIALALPPEAPALYKLGVSFYSPILSEYASIPVQEIGPIKVPPPAMELPDDLQEIDAQINGEIRLLGFTLTQDGILVEFGSFLGGKTILTCYWEALTQPGGDYHLFVHVLDEHDQIITQDDTEPYQGNYPTSVWDADEQVATIHVLDIPQQSGKIAIWVGMYRWPSLERLPAQQDRKSDPQNRILLWK